MVWCDRSRVRTSPRILWLLLAATFCALAPQGGMAQTTLNPDISLIGDVRSFWHDDSTRADGKALNLELHEVEIAVQGYLNPYARADVFASWGNEGSEVEEAYITVTRGLPWGLALRAGQYRLEVGKINALHPHACPFIVLPLAHEQFFGEEGLRDVAVEISAAPPTGSVASTIAVDLLKGSFLDFPASAANSEPPNKRGFSARWNSFVTLGTFTSLNLGASAVTGVPAEGTHRWIGGADLKLRWKPDRYRGFTTVAEWLVNRQPAVLATTAGTAAAAGTTEYLVRHGFFGYFDYQFRQRFEVGGMGDWTQAPADRETKFWRLGAFGGFAPVEETSLLRLLVAYERNAAATTGFWSATLQLIFSLGPHKAHAF